MTLFEEIEEFCYDVDSLEEFICCNMQNILDFDNGSNTEIEKEKELIYKFISFKKRLLENLDYSKVNNKAFLAILFDLCERLDLVSTFQIIVNIVQCFDIDFGKRLEAVKLYMLSISCNSDFISRFDQIYDLLDQAYECEEDNEDGVLVSFASYYKRVIDTSQSYINKFKDKTQQVIQQHNDSFLNCAFIRFLFSIDTKDYLYAIRKIQEGVEYYLSNKYLDVCIETPKAEALIERETDYSDLLASINPCFVEVRNLSLCLCENISDIDTIGTSLKRGVSILDDENQMVLYMKRFGNMHYAKLISAFEFFVNGFTFKKVEIIDWGCGQALASMSFAEYFKEVEIEKIILIEPSKICLKRAALHVNKFALNSVIKTVNKELDKVSVDDISLNNNLIKVHLFSNILDLDTFSLIKLIDKLKATQKGINYFVCVSPYITDVKTARIDSFMNYFSNTFSSFELIANETNSSDLSDVYWSCNNNYKGNIGIYCDHLECGCINKWTRVLRVFKVVF